MARGRPVVRQTRALVKGGAIPAPPWLAAVEAVPAEPPLSAPRPSPISFPEDRLRRNFLRRYPSAGRLPVAIDAPNGRPWHVTDAFVRRQMDLIATGSMSESEASDAVEKEFGLDPGFPESVRALLEDQGRALSRENIFAPLLSASEGDGDDRTTVFSASLEESRRDSSLHERIRNKTNEALPEQ